MDEQIVEWGLAELREDHAILADEARYLAHDLIVRRAQDNDLRSRAKVRVHRNIKP